MKRTRGFELKELEHDWKQGYINILEDCFLRWESGDIEYVVQLSAPMKIVIEKDEKQEAEFKKVLTYYNE